MIAPTTYEEIVRLASDHNFRLKPFWSNGQKFKPGDGCVLNLFAKVNNSTYHECGIKLRAQNNGYLWIEYGFEDFHLPREKEMMEYYQTGKRLRDDCLCSE